MNKSVIRAELISKRRSLSQYERMAAAKTAAHLLMAEPIFQQASTIACYSAHPDEFPTGPIIEAIWNTGKQCYLPILLISPHKELQFALYEKNNELRTNQYKILEPINTPKLPAEKLDLVLLPLVGFDLKGRRLGMGGGFYDRTFAFLSEKKPKKPYLIGLAFERQKVEELPSDPWDVALNMIITEKRIIYFNHANPG